MPVNVEVKVEYLSTWAGRLMIIQLLFEIVCMILTAPAYDGPQHWFLFVLATSFTMTFFFLMFHLFLSNYLGTRINWKQIEFWYSALYTLFYFTAFLAMLIEFAGVTLPQYQTWVDAQVAAGVFGLFLDIAYALLTYVVYLDWRANPNDVTTSA